MTARARSIVSPLALIAAALALAYALSLIPTLGLAHGAPVAAAVSAPPMRLDPGAAVQPQLEPPPGEARTSAPEQSIAAPEATIDDVQALFQRGEVWAGLIVGVFILFTALHKADPKRAWFYTAGTTLLGGAVGMIAVGVMPTQGMAIGILAGLVGTALRGPGLPSRSPTSGKNSPGIPDGSQPITRTPERGSGDEADPNSPEAARERLRSRVDLERGSALLGLLAPLAACALVVLAAGHLWGCAGQAKATASDVGFCATASAGLLVDDLQQAIVSNTDEAGHVNWDAVEVAVKERLRRYGREVVACATRRAIDRILETQTLVRVDREELERGWQRLRAGVLADADRR